jgi:hypothetical protein
MAEIVTRRLADDLDGSDAAGTVEFSIDGMDFEIDLSEANATELRAFLFKYMQAARPRKPNGKVGQKRNRAVNPATVAAREWWRQEGGRNGVRDFQAKGRIPTDVMELAEAAGVFRPVLRAA